MNPSRSICFIANDYRFFFRHFRPAILAALSRNFEVTAFLPTPDNHGDGPSEPVHVIPAPIARKSLTILDLVQHAAWLIKHIRQERPEIVVAFSVRTSLALALALPFVRVKKVVFYMTGLGLLELMPDLKARVLRGAAYGLLRATSRRANCYFIFENQSDPVSMGFKPSAPERKLLLVGAGVDDSEFVPKDFPPPGIFKVATASRLVWSKGIDVAARAASELVSEGHAIELDVYGSPDPANPRSLDPATLADLPGVSFRGHTDDVAGIWERHHAAVFATRGGEGVPRSLLEAAACGRPCIVTDVAGCRDFIRDGIEGYVVAPDSVASLKEALLKLMADPERLHAFGRAARERVLQASTSRIVQQQYVELFDL